MGFLPERLAARMTPEADGGWATDTPGAGDAASADDRVRLTHDGRLIAIGARRW